MDEYIEFLTLAVSGRVRPFKYEIDTSPHFMIHYASAYCIIEFIERCNNAEFREYYFRPNFISLKYLELIKEILFNCKPEVFEYLIRTFRDQYKNIEISCHYTDSNMPALEFKNICDIKYNPLRYTTITYYVDYYVQLYNPGFRNIMELLGERGFVVYNSGMDSYATLALLDLP